MPRILKFTPEEEAEICRLYLRERVKQSELARLLNTSQGNISRIVSRAR